MLRFIFNNIKILNKKKFIFFLFLYLLTFLFFCFLCGIEYLKDITLIDTFIPWYLFNISYNIYHMPIYALIWAVVSFVEILLIAFQTNLKGPRLNRFVLCMEVFNLIFTVIGLCLNEGFIYTLMILGFLFLLLFVPTYIVVKVKERNGTYDYSDIMTKEEIEEYKRNKNI